MFERIPSIAVLAGVALLGNGAMGQETSQLRVTAVVPPRPCQYPDRCEVETTTAPPAQTKVTVIGDSLSYVGSPPIVTKTDDRLKVLF